MTAMVLQCLAPYKEQEKVKNVLEKGVELLSLLQSEQGGYESGGEDSSESISQDDALSQAKDYYGSDAEYSYKKKVTVGDKEYYDFSVKGDDISSTDVLVSVDGQDVIGGTQNDDGSWSFDQ